MTKIHIGVLTEDESGKWKRNFVDGVLIGKQHALIVDGYHMVLKKVVPMEEPDCYSVTAGANLEKEIEDPQLLDKIDNMTAVDFLNAITCEPVRG